MLDNFTLANFLYGNGLISPIYFNKFLNIHTSITNLKVHNYDCYYRPTGILIFLNTKCF